MTESFQSDKALTRTFFLVSVMCLAQVLTMLGVFAVPALLPFFIGLWDLNNTQAGWISGIYFAGYSIAVPLLTSFTDRVDSRKIYLASCLVGVAANIGFAVFSQGFWSALVFRALCGISLAGTFIPGLKALIDRVESRYLHRTVSFYTACFGLGMSLSFYYAGLIHEWFGWEAVFFIAAACSATVLLVCFRIMVPKPVTRSPAAFKDLLQTLDFRPVWRNLPARTYILAYMCHMWEMFAARSWMVTFLTFSLAQQTSYTAFMAPTTVMAVAGILGMIASILFGEFADKFNRRSVISFIMAVSGLFSMSICFISGYSYSVIALLCIGYTIFFQGDSAAIHAGVIKAADPERQGSTMALQSLGGFAAASLSPIIAGGVLDITGGGNTAISWGFTFSVMGIAALPGIFLLSRIQR